LAASASASAWFLRSSSSVFSSLELAHGHQRVGVAAQGLEVVDQHRIQLEPLRADVGGFVEFAGALQVRRRFGVAAQLRQGFAEVLFGHGLNFRRVARVDLGGQFAEHGQRFLELAFVAQQVGVVVQHAADGQ
jgi:hypothetical protein